VKVESGEVPVEVAAEPAGADRWIPPETPKYGLQEEFWLVDWGKGTRGFISAYILKPDGEKIMGSDQAEVRNTEGAADLLRAAPVFLEWGERWNSIRLESAEKMLYIVSLAEHYLLVVTLDARSVDKEASERRLQALIESLNETLRKA
jgi:hypothetical protein